MAEGGRAGARTGEHENDAFGVRIDLLETLRDMVRMWQT
jgi:hypothetical protein